ncbi:MAG: hypothetical protein HOK80_00575 [Candidatus Cloacimonetes bacterium]|jgi:hypothetical protein|nr:hypothetical protein [Candidatus Cloacimonadota bacterium]MBT4333820.1 hypothetical protein [Candidatus Cloacimonadota bacterium]MBT4575534.1 hypothetical protein [Candidatus Cloacimonadota bacterium]MBT5419363.1 hypothetical protein [Candidatus Cloacimonadota bacterium]
MEKIILALFIILSSCFWGSVMDFSEQDIKDNENEVFNSSFENGEFDPLKLPDNWFLLEDTSKHVIWDSENPHTGSKSLKIEHPKDKINIISDAFPVDADYVYYSRLFVKTNYNSNQSITIRFLAFDAKGKRVSKFSNSGLPKQDWAQIDITSGFLKSTARFGRIIISIPRKSDKIYWLDDIESYAVYRIQK